MSQLSDKTQQTTQPEQTICQSCGMPLTSKDDHGNNGDGSKNAEYCRYCFTDGAFSKDETLEEMVESCIPFALQAGRYSDQEAARRGLMRELKNLKRWA